MSSSPVFKKTATGQTEVDTNEHELTALQRRVLILVNGSNDNAALAKKSLCKGIDETLAYLQAKNLVEPVADQAVETAPEEITIPLEQTQPGGGDNTEAREFLSNTLLTYCNRVRVAKLIDEIDTAADADGLRQLINSWYREISETPNGVYDADNLKQRALEMLGSD